MERTRTSTISPGFIKNCQGRSYHQCQNFAPAAHHQVSRSFPWDVSVCFDEQDGSRDIACNHMLAGVDNRCMPCGAGRLELLVRKNLFSAKLSLSCCKEVHALWSWSAWSSTSSGQGASTSWSTLMTADTWCVPALSTWFCPRAGTSAVTRTFVNGTTLLVYCTHKFKCR